MAKSESTKKRIKTKIKWQLYMVYALAIFLPVIFVGFYLLYNTRGLLKAKSEESIKSDNLRVKGIVLDLTRSVDAVGSFFWGDSELAGIISGEYADLDDEYDAYRNYQMFATYKENHIEISRIELYIDTKIEYGSFKNASARIQNSEWYKKAIATPQPVWVSEDYTNSMGLHEQELWYVRRIPTQTEGKYAILVIAVNNNHLKSRISNNKLSTDLCVNDGVIFYSDNNNTALPVSGIKIDYDNKYYEELLVTDDNVLIQVSTLNPVSTSDSIYILTYDYESVVKSNGVIYGFLLILIISALVPFFLFTVFANMFSNRIMTLRQAMHKASNGDYEITDKIKGNDELADVFNDMEKMIESIMQMDKEIYSARIKEEQINTHQQRIKYSMLASQINPHFLYNTLETIRMKALSANDREVARAIKLLGKSMRHVLDAGMHTVTLKSELDYISMYLEIQHIRFGERLSYIINVDENIDTEGYYILPLLLQPVVENAAIHGLESQTGMGELYIHAGKTKDKLIITVEDNGKGMPKEELEALISRMTAEKLESGKSIGLNNVYHRIKLFYGEEYTITITSEKGMGTSAKIFLPAESPVSVDLDSENTI